MEEPRERWSDQERKKMAVRIGGAGVGGGFGAVLLLGGALATAALASAFIVRKQGRSSGKGDSGRGGGQSQDSGSSPEINEQNKQDEANNGQYRSGAINEVEKDNDKSMLVSTEILKLDEKVEIVKIHDVCNEIALISKDLEKLHIEEEGAEVEQSYDSEIEGTKTNGNEAVERTEMQPRDEGNVAACYDQEEVDVTVEDNAVEGVCNDQKEVEKIVMDVGMEGKELEGLCDQEVLVLERSETVVSERRGDDGEDVVMPVFESRGVEERIVSGDEKEGTLVEVKYVKELVEEQERGEQSDEGIVTEKGEELGLIDEGNLSNTQRNLQTEMDEEKIDSENKEDDAGRGDPAPENRKFDVPMLEEEVISHEVTKEYGADEEQVSEIPEVNEISVVSEILEVNEKETSIVSESPEVNEKETSIVSESSEVNEKETSRVSESLQVNEKETLILSESLEVNENENSIVAAKLEVKEEKIQVVAESLEVEEDNHQPEYVGDDSQNNIAKEVEEGLISHDDTKVDEIQELNENMISTQFADNFQPKDDEDDLERNVVEEVEQDVISQENNGITTKDSPNEEVADSVVQENTSVQQENGVGKNIEKELDDSSETVNAGIAKTQDDTITKMSKDEENGEKVEDFGDEDSSVGTGDSSTESNSDAIWPAESLQESSIEPQKKLIEQEMVGKIQEDKTVKESEHNSKNSPFEPHHAKAEDNNFPMSNTNLTTVADTSQFPHENGNLEKIFVKKYAVNSTRWRMLIGAVSVVSSLSCSWFFGLSFVKLCLIVFLTMVLSKIHG